MSFRDIDIREFLGSINLKQYFPNFQDFGYNTLRDCAGINDNSLQQIGISPTGHRRRILKQLGAMLAKMPAESVCVQSPRAEAKEDQGNGSSQPFSQSFKACNLDLEESITLSCVCNELTNTPCGNRCLYEENQGLADHESLGAQSRMTFHLDSSDSSCPDLSCSENVSGIPGKELSNGMSKRLPPVDDLLDKGKLPTSNAGPREVPFPPSTSSSAGMKASDDELLMLSGLENSAGTPSPDCPFFEFQGEMVENDLYSASNHNPTKLAPRLTRSFMLRHRPVPEIPGSSTAASSASFSQEKRNMNGLSICCSEDLISQRDPADEKPPPISPYGETFLISCSEELVSYLIEFQSQIYSVDEVKQLYFLFFPFSDLSNTRNQKTLDNVVKNESLPREDNTASPHRFMGEYEYSSVKGCARYARKGKYKTSKAPRDFQVGHLDLSRKELLYFSQPAAIRESVSGSGDSITPYACFYGPAMKKTKEGWLDKLSPQGKHMFQKRWVKFDGDSMSYYNNDKEVYSKGIIFLSAMSAVRGHGDNKFEVVTAHRIFVFRAEKEDERDDWISMIRGALQSQPEISRARTTAPPEKSGYLELKGYKAKIFTLLQGNNVWICKNDQDFKTGYGITIIPMNVANVRQVDRTAKQSFEIITPYRSF
ncbi:hypothetical protein JRQ81_016379, partial [Phrynocephalus forsythii]